MILRALFIAGFLFLWLTMGAISAEARAAVITVPGMSEDISPEPLTAIHLCGVPLAIAEAEADRPGAVLWVGLSMLARIEQMKAGRAPVRVNVIELVEVYTALRPLCQPIKPSSNA